LADESGARWDDRFFRWHVEVRDVSDEGGLDGSGMVVSQGFERSSLQLETMTRRGRTEEDRAMRFGKSKGSLGKLLGRCWKEK
jgi:hypothetical protein